MASHTLFVPNLYPEDLEAEGMSESTASMKVNERKKDVRRIEAALESLGIPFKHQRVGTTAKLTAHEVEQLMAILPNHLPSRSGLDIHEEVS